MRTGGRPLTPDTWHLTPQEPRNAATLADYERWLDSKYAAARGHVDAVIDPLGSRDVLSLALEVAMHRPRATPLVEETV